MKELQSVWILAAVDKQLDFTGAGTNDRAASFLRSSSARRRENKVDSY